MVCSTRPKLSRAPLIICTASSRGSRPTIPSSPPPKYMASESLPKRRASELQPRPHPFCTQSRIRPYLTMSSPVFISLVMRLYKDPSSLQHFRRMAFANSAPLHEPAVYYIFCDPCARHARRSNDRSELSTRVHCACLGQSLHFIQLVLHALFVLSRPPSGQVFFSVVLFSLHPSMLTLALPQLHTYCPCPIPCCLFWVPRCRRSASVTAVFV
jgi:hypothetical protein